MPCNITFSNTPQPCGNPTITSYEVEIRATGNIEGVADPAANPAGEVLATWSDTVSGGSMAMGDPKWTINTPSNLVWNADAGFSGSFPMPVVNETAISEDIEVCHRVTNACGTSEWACSTVVALIPVPISFVQTSVPDNTQPVAEFCLGGRIDQDGSIIPLDNGDLLHITIPQTGVDVELIVGQDPLTPAGYQNDIGTELWADMIPHLSATGSFTPTALLTDSYCLSFNKRDYAVDRGPAGGLIGVGAGQEYVISNEVIDVSSNKTDVSTADPIPIFYGIAEWEIVTTETSRCVCTGLSEGVWMRPRDSYLGIVEINTGTSTSDGGFFLTTGANPPVLITHDPCIPQESLDCYDLPDNTTWEADHLYNLVDYAPMFFAPVAGQTAQINSLQRNGGSSTFWVNRSHIRPAITHTNKLTRTIDSFRFSIRATSFIASNVVDVTVDFEGTGIVYSWNTMNQNQSTSQISDTGSYTYTSDGVYLHRTVATLADARTYEQNYPVVVYSF